MCSAPRYGLKKFGESGREIREMFPHLGSIADGFGYAAVENAVAIHDFHATMLCLLGIDHKRLAVQPQGLDARLTGVSGDVVKGIVS
jgi:hypothetical protein